MKNNLYKLNQATFQNFTTLPNSEWQFAEGINVIIGENGTGKSHVLKAIYSLLKVQAPSQNVPNSALEELLVGHGEKEIAKPSLEKNSLEKAYAKKLAAVMRPERLGRLVKRKPGRARCEIALFFGDKALDSAIGFATNNVKVAVTTAPKNTLPQPPVYLPTRELVTLCPWFGPLYDNYHLEFEETWRDTVSLLGVPSVKGPREKKVAAQLEALETAMGGKVTVDANGRFYLSLPSGRMEMPLVAEGLRKLAMLARLISTGVLLEQGYLFWDEPETNLHPKLIKAIAETIVKLADSGIQIFLATHSLFLLRELDMLTQKKTYGDLTCRYFALTSEPEGITLQQGARIDDIQNVALLDEELLQSDRFMSEENT